MLLAQAARPRRRWNMSKSAAFVMTMFFVLLTSFDITNASAGSDMVSGQYTGYHTDDPNRPLSFSVSDTGQIGTIYTEYTTSCYYQPLPVTWDENPPIQIAADGSFYAEWIIEDTSNPDNDVRHTFQGSIDSSGVASGTMSSYYYKLSTCNDRTEPWVAVLDGGSIDSIPTISLSVTLVDQNDLADSGITVTGSDFAAGGTVSFFIDNTPAGTATVSSDGTFTATAQASMRPGEYTVTASIGNQSASATLTVDAVEEDQDYNPEITILQSPIDDDILFYTGVEVVGSGFPPNSPLTVTIGGVEAGSTTTDEDGAFEVTARGSASIGANLLRVVSGNTSASRNLIVEPGEGTIETTEPTTVSISTEIDAGAPVFTETEDTEAAGITDQEPTETDSAESETSDKETAANEPTTEPAAIDDEDSDPDDQSREGLGAAFWIGLIVVILAVSGVLLFLKLRKR